MKTILKHGMNSPQVGEMKVLLSALGYKGITAGNNDFGNATKAAVIQFQRDNGFPDTGEFGAREWETATALTSPTKDESIITPERLGRSIIASASRFLNLREVKPNSRWDNPATPGIDAVLCKELRALMKESPWEEGWAYCLAFAEGVVADGLRNVGATSSQVAKFRAAVSPHVMSTVASLKARKWLSPSTDEPGSIWLAQHGTGNSGHAGILVGRNASTITNIEANTSKDAQAGDKDREGDWITTKTFSAVGRGALRTRGFLSVSTIIQIIS